jgi:hypothetical protein
MTRDFLMEALTGHHYVDTAGKPGHVGRHHGRGDDLVRFTGQAGEVIRLGGHKDIELQVTDLPSSHSPGIDRSYNWRTIALCLSSSEPARRRYRWRCG